MTGSRRLAFASAWAAAALALGACRGPAGLTASPLEALATRPTPVPDEPDHAARDLAVAALGQDRDAARARQPRLEALERQRTLAGDLPTGLPAYGQHLVDATLPDAVAYRRATAELLRRDDVDPALRTQLEREVADDPLALAQDRIGDARVTRVARTVNAFSQAAGTSILTVAAAPLRLAQAAIGLAVAEHMDDPISVQERQALGHWKQYVETHPESPEAHELLVRIDAMQGRWFAMKRERSVRAAGSALEQGDPEIALVLADRALQYAPEDGEAAQLRSEAEREVLARRASRARSLGAPVAAPVDTGDPRARALAVALLAPGGDVAGAARALLEADPEGPLAGEARYAEALAAAERGEESRAWDALGELADEDPARSPIARHARASVASPSENPYRAFREARVDAVEDQASYVLLGPLAKGARDRNLPTAVEWLLEGTSLVSTLGGIPSRLVQTAIARPQAQAPAVYAERYLERFPNGEHAEDLRAWLVDHHEAAGNHVRAESIARGARSIDAERAAELADAAAAQALEYAQKQQRRDLRVGMLQQIAAAWPDTPAGREAGQALRKEFEEATAQSIRISRGFLRENPALAGPAGLGLHPGLIDGSLANGELHPDGVTLVGGRVLEFALVAASGDEDEPPKKVRRQVSAERLARTVSLLEETSTRNALLDPLALQGPDADRDRFFERARLGVADTPDPSATAESSYAFLGVREKYGMVRRRESILPVELVIQGSFPDMGLGAFPRLKTPRETPDAVLYR